MELLDDIEDHWDSSTHDKERRECIRRFQEHAKLHHHRVSFISGDVHCAQVGRLYTSPKVRRCRSRALRSGRCVGLCEPLLM